MKHTPINSSLFHQFIICAGLHDPPDVYKRQVESGEVRDLSAVDFRQIIDVPTPANPEEFRRMRSKTVARIGVWRAGPRCRTNTYLRFRADHAAAMDAVFTDVPERLLEEMGLFTVQTLCETKDMYLTRPDLGLSLIHI